MLEKLSNTKNDVWKQLENAQAHSEEMLALVKCYQESDWTGL